MGRGETEVKMEAIIPFRGSSLFLLIFVGHLLGCTFTYMLNYESDLNWMVRRCLRKQGPRVDDKSGITLSHTGITLSVARTGGCQVFQDLVCQAG